MYTIPSPTVGNKTNQTNIIQKKSQSQITPTHSPFCLWKNFRIIIMQACSRLLKHWSKNTAGTAGKLNAKGLLGWETEEVKTF